MSLNKTGDTLSRRYKAWQLLDASESSRLAKIVDWSLIVIIAITVLAVMLETDEDYHERYEHWFYLLEIFSVSIFTVEYLVRVWSSVENPSFSHYRPIVQARLKYMLTPMALIDLIAIAPFYLAFLVNIDLRFLRVLRLLRIFKLTRYSAAMNTLLMVLREEVAALGATLFIMLIIMIMAASGIYLVEHKLQPDEFGSIPQALWWAIVTLTSVGYGDVTPVSAIGKVYAAVIMVAGVGLVALPTGILASTFSDHMHRGRSAMSREINKALHDGVIDEVESAHLEAIREKLGISEESFQQLLYDSHEGKPQRREMRRGHGPNCPHCGKSLR